MSIAKPSGRPTLLTVSGVITDDVREQVAQGLRPCPDYLALSDGLDADLIDYAAARASTGVLGAICERIGGPNLLLAFACWKLRKHYQAIVTDGEQIGLPLAGLLKITPGARARHVMIVHIISVAKKLVLMDRLGLHTHIDRFLTYSRWQKQFIERRWQIDSRRVIWTPFMVDDAFFDPTKVKPNATIRSQICAVGLERRDYPTLLKAVEGLNIQVVIAAASPWSKYRDSTVDQAIPANVSVRKFTQFELRQLYADSRLLVMPLEPVEFQAGVTAILEAMAMGKPVLCSRAAGQTDVIVDGENGRYVAVGDADEMRAEIVRLLAHPAEMERLGGAGRWKVEREMSLARYVERLSLVVRQAVDGTDLRGSGGGTGPDTEPAPVALIDKEN